MIRPLPNVNWTIGTVGGDGVARARNNLAQEFYLKTDCELFLMIDVDIVSTPEQIAMLIEDCTAERPIVAGCYAAKQFNHRWIKTDLPGELPDPITGRQKVFEAGSGFKCIHRRYFEEVMQAFPEIQYFCDASPDRAVKWDFFSMGVVNGRYLSEDYYADYRARQIGMDIYVQTKCMVTHHGAASFPVQTNWEVFKSMTVEQVAELAKQMGGRATDAEKPTMTVCEALAGV